MALFGQCVMESAQGIAYGSQQKPPEAGGSRARQAITDREGIDPRDRHNLHGGIGQKTFIGLMKGRELIMPLLDGQSLFPRQSHDNGPGDAI